MAETSKRWTNQVRLSLWISGHRSALLSINDAWRLTLSSTVILMTLALGTIIAVTMTMSHLTAGDQTFYLQAPFIVVPLIATISSTALISAVFYFRYRRSLKSGAIPDVITVPVTLISLITSTPILFLFNGMKYLAGGLSLEALLLITAVAPIVYTLISDYIHFLIVQYVAPSILGRDQIYPPGMSNESARHSGLLGLFRKDHARPLKLQNQSDNQKREHARWSDIMCLSLWIAGRKMSLMSIRELWAIVFSRFVLTLSIMIGSTAGIASAITLLAVGDETYFVLMLFSIAPVLINIGSATLMSLYVFVRLRRVKDGTIPVIVIPSALTIYASALPIIFLIYSLKVALGGLGEGWVIYVMTITPVAYVLISDFFHYVVFFFVAPSIWSRAHVYEPAEFRNNAQAPIAVRENNELQAAFLHSPEIHEVQIGNTTLSESDLVFLEAQGNYLRVVTDSIERLERFRISAAVEQLNDDLGVLLHRSYWVAFSGIERVTFHQGQCKVQTTHGEIINVASTRQNSVVAALKERGLIAAS